MDYEKFVEKNKALQAAFRELRKAGFLARMNYLCCGSCAGYAITTKAVEMIDSGIPKEDIKGCVFFSRQDNAERLHHGVFAVSYGPMHSTEYGVIGLPVEEVGKIVIEMLAKHGINAEWSGKGKERIHIDLEVN